MKRLAVILSGAFIATFMMVITIPGQKAQADNTLWEGVWFTCEHAQRQRAPDDGCQMFDDEGFEYKDGKLRYLRMKGSEARACKGQKKGQCFLRNKPSIKVTKSKIGDVRIENSQLIVRYMGCDQRYHMSDATDYMVIKPVKKNCFWSQERHFYIARYDGTVSLYKP